jgi:transcriptional regulator with XRE-family HTH domain
MRSSTCHNNEVVHYARKLHFHRAVGERIREAREKAGVSQRALAELCGVAVSTLHNAEMGSTVPLYLVALIAQNVDGVTIEELVPLVEDP